MPLGHSHTRPRRSIVAALVATVLAAVTTGAQEAPQPPDLHFEEQIGIEWVIVPVVATSSRGPVGRLAAGDFRLRVDGREIPNVDFDRDDRAPLHLVILQDLSGSMGTHERLRRSRQAILDVLAHLRPGDQMALGTFANEGLHVDVPTTDDVAVLREAVAGWQAYGQTALHDAIAWIPRIAGESRAVRTAVLLITDGVDNASRLDPAAARAIVQEAKLPVYTLGLSSGDVASLTAEGEKVHRYADTLNLLSHQTGGRYVPLTARQDIVTAVRAILDELRQQYVLSFPIAAGDGPQHRIDVLLDGHRRVQLQYRRSYRGGAPVP